MAKISFAIALLMAAALPVAANPAFYTSLLDRGIAHAAEGKHELAVQELRIAAFGLLDSIPQFQLAQVHIALASQKLGREADARHALQRIVAAERIQRSFTSLELTPELRKEIDALASALLTTEQLAVLRGDAAQEAARVTAIGTRP